MDNPRVNRHLADKTFDHMDHALGRPMWPLRETFRNHFAVYHDEELVSAFAASEFWTKSGQQGETVYFHVTEAGKHALAEHLAVHDQHQAFEVTWDHHTEIIPALTPGKAKYKYYLRVSDVMDIRFVDFSKNARVRKAA